jgi:hypothetical protein
LLNTGTARGTFSAGLIPLIVDFVVGRRGVNAATARAWREDLDGLGEATFFSLNRYLFCARVPS